MVDRAVLLARCAYCHSVDAFAWSVVGSVAGVVGTAAAIVFGLIPLLQRRKAEIPAGPSETQDEASPGRAGEEAPVVVGEIPQKPLGFQPRAGLLSALDAPGPGSRVVVVHAVTGMRGVGKTHLAAAYARARLAERWRLVAWINAEDLGGVLAGLVSVAVGLGLGAAQRDAVAAGRAVRHWLEADGQRCLLVFDNATSAELLRPFIPAAGAARVIITSNYQSVVLLGSGVPVDVFSEPEALTFLAARSGQADAAGAQVLAVELGCLPLALAQAAAVIASQHLSYGTYLERLGRLPVGELLAAEEAGQYPRGVAAAVLFSLESIRAGERGVACGAVMDLLAVLSATGVRRSLIRAAAREGLPGRDGPLPALAPEVADWVLGRLAGVSLLTFSVDDTSVTAHRLVMRVIREQLAVRNSLTSVCAAAAQLLDGLAEELGNTWHQDRAAVRDLVEHITALYESSASRPADSALLLRMIGLRWWAVVFLSELGDSAAQTIPMAEPLLPDTERVLGTDHPRTLGTRANLAAAYRAVGRTDEAITLYEQTLPGQERVRGTNHPDTLTTRGNLAAAYQAAGRTDEAIALYEQTLADQERVLGTDHPDTLGMRGILAVAYQLAAAYQGAGRTDEAITLYERTLADQERVLGTDHPDTLTTRGNLAAAYQGAGRTDEAITLYERTLADQERVLGTDHPDTLTTRGNLAAAYRAVSAIPARERQARWRKSHR